MVMTRSRLMKRLDRNSRRTTKRSSVGRRRLLARGIERLELRRLLAATTPDIFTLHGQSTDYLDGAFFQQHPVFESVNIDGESVFDLRVDEPGDQVVLLTMSEESSDVGIEEAVWLEKTSQRILVDSGNEYRFDAISYSSPLAESLSLRYAAYDSVGNRIAPIHVRKLAGAIDTVLVEEIEPGDTSIVVADAAGWSNDFGIPAQTRALAWFSDQYASGQTGTGNSYTRNVLGDRIAGAWSPGGITEEPGVGFRIELSQPWSGESVLAGTAIRNAVGDHGLFQWVHQEHNDSLRPSNNIKDIYEQSIQVTTKFGGLSWDAQQERQSALPPVASAIEIYASSELINPTVRFAEGSEASVGDRVALDSYFVAPDEAVMITPDSQSHRYSLELDVLTNDSVAVDSSGNELGVTVVSVDSPNFGTVEILEDGRIGYQSLSWFVGVDRFTYTVRDSDQVDRTETVSITITGTNMGEDPLLVAALADHDSGTGIVEPTIAKDGAALRGGYVAVSGETLHVDGDHVLDLFSNDSEYGRRVLPAAAVLLRSTAHGSLSLQRDGTNGTVVFLLM